ncbi:hypothetical protein GXW83_15030 [Streptacidiphilus sp. PB12-B1b]|uniref:hypothetical protein n=1 Tax=Streptacidiphilus sp. PB12-B1b TaxID=2705012 RepID=UPI0015FE3DA2|nr:hypothetical protein [Streptacidiphilus sp. PB12-B1b]QMU76851.1 hypothetical protein GXW83_15030 [Streptacidiphilus sp. PB12-B1b]
MKHQRLAAVLSAPILAAGLALASGAPAQAATVHGCPTGDVCLYNTQADYNTLTIDLVVTYPSGCSVASCRAKFRARVAAAVVNTGQGYASEGHYQLLLNGTCQYQPDTKDVQAGGTTEDPADGNVVNGAEFGPTAASVSSPANVPLSNCL